MQEVLNALKVIDFALVCLFSNEKDIRFSVLTHYSLYHTSSNNMITQKELTKFHDILVEFIPVVENYTNNLDRVRIEMAESSLN